MIEYPGSAQSGTKNLIIAVSVFYLTNIKVNNIHA